MKQKYLSAFMDMLDRFAQTSEAERLKVAAVLIKNDNPVCWGINGTRSGWHTNKCEDEDGKTTTATRHAEIACLDKLRRMNETSVGATLLTTHACCLPCSVEVVEAGITKVIYKHDYRCDEGIKYLRSNGVQVVKYEEN